MTMQELFKKTKKDPKILVFRSARMVQIERLLEEIKKVFSSPTVTLLVQPQIANGIEVKKISLIDNIILYEGKKFSLFRNNIRLLKKLKEERFDMVIVPYNNQKKRGYFHVDILVLLVGAEQKVGFDIFGNWTKLAIIDKEVWREIVLSFTIKPILFFVLASLLWPIAGMRLIGRHMKNLRS